MTDKDQDFSKVKFLKDNRKVYPKKIQKLLGEVCASGIINIPSSILIVIKKYQSTYQNAFGGHKLTRPEVAVLLLHQGVEATNQDIAKFEAIIEQKEADEFK